MKYIYRISLAIFYFGGSNLFLPAIAKIWSAFGHWQPAISSPDEVKRGCDAGLGRYSPFK
jgi:hypothetical protein